ncbi:interferon-inducible GTPase 1-like [Ruditapes philippinarum]|uniref:interferon-inducible GTPase 1-like n=1 Tax=Ruditapes philippinarum TaxID=129788 RepID=UPI00295B0088|nr:interferon-inducible GTPase 1-like [Ruditapes philippinarum]
MASLEDSMLSSDDAGCSLNKDEEVFIKHIREYDNFRSFIDNDELKAEKETDSLRRLNRYIKNHFKEWKDKELVVGVTGRTGSGKSSLTNKLRGINSKVKGAAAVGVIETTRDITSYKYPGNDYIILRDFPGFGTTSYPKEEYLQKTKILDSSVVIIVSCVRFSEDDVWIAQEAIALQRNVIFVRSKIDQDIDNAEEEDLDFSENTCMAKIKAEIKINLKCSDLDPQLYDIFLVSSRLNKKYDILSLHEKIKALPIMKAETICHFLFEHMKKAIADKTETIKTEFLGRKVASVFTGFLPIPKLESTTDTYHVKKIFEECEVKYCVDRDSISEFAREINMSEREIEIEIESRMKSRDDRVRDEYQLYTETEDKKWAFVQKYSKYTFPVLGMLYSAYKSPRTIQECLDKICDAMAEDELMLVKLRLRKLEKDLKS